MLDIRFVRENPELVKENIRKKFQDAKLPLVDEVIELDKANRAAIQEASDLRAARNALSKANGPLFGKLKKAEGAENSSAEAPKEAAEVATEKVEGAVKSASAENGEKAEKPKRRRRPAKRKSSTASAEPQVDTPDSGTISA